jgi:hypothetical protein
MHQHLGPVPSTPTADMRGLADSLADLRARAMAIGDRAGEAALLLALAALHFLLFR